MNKAVVPAVEHSRLEALQRLRVLDTPSDPVLDALTNVTANMCETPMARIAFVDEHRLWIKSAVGSGVTETPRDTSFCSHAILTPGKVFVVEDARKDERFKDNSLVTSASNIVFYAGIPLVTADGYAVGTLCVLDHAPRHLNARQIDSLEHLSSAVMSLLQERGQSPLTDIERKAQLFLKSAPDATLIFDDSGKLVLANREAEYLFGYTHEELVSMPVEALIPARYRHQHLAHRKHYTVNPIVREMGQAMNTMALTKSGAEIPVDIRLSPIISDGKQFYSASVRDITTHTDTEQALQGAKSTAERAAKQKSRFLAAAGHDLRQPLQAISLYLSVLSRTHDEEKRSDISRKMQLSLDNINGMLGALLDVSKLDSGAIKPEKSKVKLQQIFDKILAGNLQQAHEKGLELTCSATNASVFTDPVLLERVIENFVTNAIRYTGTGQITLFTKKADQNLFIGVKDTGIGIDNAQLDQVFEEYYQLDNPMRNRSKGLGLGLSIVNHISTLLGHTIDVQSEVGSGSTFSITVPLAKFDDYESHATDPEPPLKDMLADKPQILLIEDDSDVLESTVMFLESVGIEVLTASDSDEGFAHIESGERPKMIITDYRLPGMNGYDLLLEIRKKTHINIPAIIITGDTAPSQLTETEIDNCQLLHKPVVTDKLLELIWNVI